MRVLMFGWEFPPHISGGLGPACEGITAALIAEKIEIKFVVPKLFGKEFMQDVVFIDAGKIGIVDVLRNTVTFENDGTHRESSIKLVTTANDKENTPLTYIPIASTLSPYDTENTTHTIESWNEEQEILSQYIEVLKNKKSTTTSVEAETADKAKYLTFSGTYGADLLNETARYAMVATQLATQNDFDIIHVHDWMTMPAGVAAKRLSGKKLVAHVHSTVFDRSRDGIDPVIFTIEKDGLDKADKIIAVSAWTKHILVEKFHVRADKIEVVHNGIRRPSSNTVQYARIFDEPVVTFLGRITSQKGPLYFVRAAKKVLERIPNVHFVMGGSGDLFEKVVEEAARLNISENFHFSGFVKGVNVEKLWAMSDVYVMPSVSEPFGITPLEAIEAGVPVIISKQSGVSEVLDHAIKIDFWDTTALASAICNIISYRGLASTLSRNAKHAMNDLRWENAGMKINKVYTSLLENQISKSHE